MVNKPLVRPYFWGARLTSHYCFPFRAGSESPEDCIQQGELIAVTTLGMMA